jgi:hypothetical protein
MAEPTLQEVLDDVLGAIADFSASVDRRFENIETRMVTKEGFEKRLTEERVVTKDYLEKRFSQFEARMVTKDYLDDKLANLRGDLVLLARKGNQKFCELVHELMQSGSIKEETGRQILALEPFPY